MRQRSQRSQMRQRLWDTNRLHMWASWKKRSGNTAKSPQSEYPTAKMASELYADMFAEAYRDAHRQAASARSGTFALGVESHDVGGRDVYGGGHDGGGGDVPLSSLASLARRHSLHQTHCSPREESFKPTTAPATPGSMSSEHSFMATSAPASQPPPLAAQPGNLPYVLRPPAHAPPPSFVPMDQRSLMQKLRATRTPEPDPGPPVLPKSARESGLRE